MNRQKIAILAAVTLAASLQGQVNPSTAEGTESTQCPGMWTIVPTPNRQASINVLADVAAISPTDAMAVGWFGQGPGDTNPLVERWDGTRWRPAPSPDVGGEHVALVAISALGPDDVWVVGSRRITHDTYRTFATHWDGSAWMISPTPTFDGASARFTDVVALAPNDVWAVGIRLHIGGPERTLVEHWDGTRWTVTPSPNVTTATNYLATVTAAGPGDVWAVGYWGLPNSDDYLSPLYEHWDGTRWSVVGSELESSARFLLSAVAISSDDVVAVGSNGNFEATAIHKPLVFRWDGSWFDPFLPIPDGGDIGFLAVAAPGSADVWAVGYQTPPGSSNHQTFAEHWDGNAWSVCPTPNRTSEDNDLIGADEVDGVIWAVGTYVPLGSETTRTLVVRWSDS
jgi:hypothetical protein